MKLQHIKTEWDKHIIIVDPWIVDVVLGTLVGNAVIPRDPIWTMVTAKSSGGKTTLIKPASMVQGVSFIDDLTEKTLLSGFKAGKGKQETSLLKMIGNGVLAFSDFTAILSKNPNSRGEILGQLKLVYDGELRKATGLGQVEWKGKMGFLAAATPDIYWHLEQGRSMGERFSFYCMNQPTDEEIADKQSNITLSSQEVHSIMAPMYAEYCKNIREWADINGIPPLKMTPEQKLRVKEAAIFCINGKATVHTNFKSGKVDQIPAKAGVGRDFRMFETFLQTFQLMDCYEADNFNLPLSDDRVKLIQKIAYSSLNRERRKILEILSDEEHPITSSEIGSKQGLGLEKEGVDIYLIPLHAVGIIKKHVQNKRFTWSIEDKKTKAFIYEMSALTTSDKFEDSENPEEEENELSSVISEAKRRLDEAF